MNQDNSYVNEWESSNEWENDVCKRMRMNVCKWMRKVNQDNSYVNE